MKPSGFLLALTTVVAVASAQNQNYAQVNPAIWAATAAANGAKVIHVHPHAAAGPRQAQAQPAQAQSAQAQPAQAKSAQAAAGVRAEATAHAGQPASHPNAAQATAPTQAAAHTQGKPRHPGHNPGHNAVPQPSKPASVAPQTAVATVAPQGTPVAQTPQQPPNDKANQKALPTFPDSALAISKLLPDLPQDIAKVIQAALTDSPLGKIASGLITGFMTAQSTTVPVVIAGIHKSLSDAATVISTENVTKAVAALTDKSQDVIKAFVAKLGQLIVRQSDKIGVFLKKLTEVGKFSHAVAIGLSVLATLSLIFQNEVLPKIPAPLSNLPHLPIPLEELPHLLEKGPIHLDKLPQLLDKFEPIKKLLDHFGHGPLPAFGSDSKSNATSAQGQGAQDVAKAGTQANAGGPAAFANAQALPAFEPEEYYEDYGEEEETAAGLVATATNAGGATANAGNGAFSAGGVVASVPGATATAIAG